MKKEEEAFSGNVHLPGKLVKPDPLSRGVCAAFSHSGPSVQILLRGMQNSGGSAEARPLFGGALSALIPPNATDISELREIPDNQEVFTHAHTDQSLIVELMEYQAQVADHDAAKYHFEDIAESNGALEPGVYAVTSVVALPTAELSMSESSSAWMLTGTQCVSKFNEEAKNTVTLHLGLFRLPQFTTDILVTFNDPQAISPESSSATAAETHREPWTLLDFQRMLQSLTLSVSHWIK